MKEKDYTGLVPQNDTGVLIDSASSEEFKDAEHAKAFYEIAKNRLTDVNRWHEIAGTGSAEFQLIDENGQRVTRQVQKNDYFKIDIPGPGSKAGEGYDWVHVEDLKEVSQEGVDSIGILVRPSTNPQSKDNSIAHFYSEDSTSTFVVTRENNRITATVYDRNTKPNTDSESIVDKIRHVAAGIGAILGGSKLQWKGLAKGLINHHESKDS